MKPNSALHSTPQRRSVCMLNAPGPAPLSSIVSQLELPVALAPGEVTPTRLLASECEVRRFIPMFAWHNKISRSRIFERGCALKSAVRDLAAACFRPRALRVHLDAATMKGTAGGGGRTPHRPPQRRDPPTPHERA